MGFLLLYEQYKDNVEGLQDEMDGAYGMIEELQETKRELFHDLLPDDGEQYFSNRVSLEDLENLID